MPPPPDSVSAPAPPVDGVVELIASQDQSCSAGIGPEHLNFGSRAKRIIDRRVDGVVASAHCFGHHVVCIVDIVSVVTAAADHRVGTTPAVQRVGRVVAGQSVVEIVADRFGGDRAGQDKIFDVRGEREADRRHDGIGTCVLSFDDAHPCLIDKVGVVAGTAVEIVGPAAALESVGSGAAVDAVGELVAGQRKARGARVGAQELDFRAGLKCVVDTGEDRVAAASDRFGHHIVGVVDIVSVVTHAADHCVGAGAAINSVVAAIAINGIGTGGRARLARDRVRGRNDVIAACALNGHSCEYRQV